VKYRIIYLASLSMLLLGSCTPVKTNTVYQYKLEGYSQQTSPKRLPYSLLISQPDAMVGYQTEQMMYIQRAYQLSAFSENTWVGPPANMFYPLLVQSFQSSHAFKAIASSPFADKVDYRLDTQILAMEQSFLTKPSTYIMKVKAVLSHVTNNQVLSSRILTVRIPCHQDSPYGGVVAANKASKILTQRIQNFVIQAIEN
jgi:cholesterol transport system auxiliary component